jgi:hypothetical protein
MGARDGLLLLVGLCGIAAAGDPKPKELDVKAIRDKMFVLEDAQGMLYAVYRDVEHTDESRVFYGPNTKALYEQTIVTTGSNEASWEVGVWSPKFDGLHPASIVYREDEGFFLFCQDGHPERSPLKEVPADRAKQLVTKAAFLSTAIIRKAHLLARDDAGVYYYVDELRQAYGGGGTRVLVGKKGAMKQLPLIDTAHDSAGEIYSTKSGEIRFVFDRNETGKNQASFVKGAKKIELRIIDLDVNSRLIYRDLGVYGALATPCESS